MTHRETYNAAKAAAKKHKKLCALLADIESEKFGFIFADTDSDKIIDTVNCGTDSYSFDDYLKEMNYYKKAAEESGGNPKANGIYLKSLKEV